MASAPNLPTEQLLELMLTLKKTTPAAARTILNGQPAIAYALITLMVQMNAINIEVFQKTLAGFQASAGQAAAAQPSHAPSTQHVPPPAPHIPPHMAPPHLHSASSTPIPAIPPHMQHPSYPPQYHRTATPPHPTGTPPMGVPPPSHQAAPPQAVYGGYPISNGYGAPPPPPHTGHHPTPPPPGYPQQAPQYGYHNQGYPPQHMPPPHQPQPQQPVQSMPPPALAETLAAIPDDQKALIMRVISMTPEQIHALPPQERSTYIQIRTTLGIATPSG